MSNILYESEETIMSEFDRHMRDTVQRVASGKLLHMIEYHLGWRDVHLGEMVNPNMGKRGRPMLSVLMFYLFNSNYQHVFPAAAAIEFTHNFSLVFDDIQDQDGIRRGKPAVWSVWGADEAINVGCVLHTLASIAITDMSAYSGTDVMIELHKYMNDAMIRMCTGQQMDIDTTKNGALISVEEYLNVISGKTAALFEASAYIGALCGGADQENLTLCKEFGYNLGMCFQIFDDVIGIWGAKERGLDKPSSDLEKRKKTYPSLYGYAQCKDRQDARMIEQHFANVQSDTDTSIAVRAVLDAVNAKEHSLELGFKYLHKCQQALLSISGSELVKQRILTWIQFVTNKQLQTIDVSETAYREVAATQNA